jgi:mono/diheme cytochrome c family protein
MRLHRSSIVLALLAGAGCIANGDSQAGEPSSAAQDPATDPSLDPSVDPAFAATAAASITPTPTDVAATCAADARVVVGAVSATVCIGANLFFRDPFGGNGRTCATCHRVNDNLTIDPKFIATLPKTDPLFIAEQVTALKDLEKPPQMHEFGLILENVDGFLPDPTTHFVLRSVPHTLSLATSVTRPPGSPNPPADRTGWSGDGAPNPGALRDFMTGAITQHYTKSLARIPGTDFVLANPTQLDQIDAFMRETGRTNELTLGSVVMSDAGAENGRSLFLGVGCNACHGNAGANIGTSNFNFNTGVESSRNPALAAFPHDGGFGTTPRPDGSFGDGTFNVPPLIEAADTGPFFHTATSVVGAPAHNVATATTIEEAIAFYTTAAFRNAPDGFVINLTAAQIDNVGRFLRGINAVFSAAIAIRRIETELAIIAQFHSNQIALQRQLIQLANVETNDAINVLSAVTNLNATSVTQFKDASTQLNTALTVTSESARVTALNTAHTLLLRGSGNVGTNLAYKIGDGSVMF